MIGVLMNVALRLINMRLAKVIHKADKQIMNDKLSIN